MLKYHLDNSRGKGCPLNQGLGIWSSQVAWGTYEFIVSDVNKCIVSDVSNVSTVVNVSIVSSVSSVNNVISK